MNEMKMRILLAVILLSLGAFFNVAAAQSREPSLDSCVESLRADLSGDFGTAWKNPAEARAQEGANSCTSARSMLLDIVAWDRDGRDFHQVPVWQLPDSQAFFFVSGMAIDADGAPNAYNPANTGLDELANAGVPGDWNGIITDREGNPLIQQGSDPFPGYYISCTSLSDETKKFLDPTAYVDASKIPYVVLPEEVANRGGAQLGDFAIVMNLRNGKSSFAIYADIGTLGEGSAALADVLGIRSDARHGGASGGILYLLFPGSGNLRPRTIGEIQREGEKLLSNWAERRSYLPAQKMTILLMAAKKFRSAPTGMDWIIDGIRP
jgi:hypothetical protein